MAGPAVLADGTEKVVQVGDWLICRGTVIVDTAASLRFGSAYEVVEDGGLQLSAQLCRQLEETLGLGASTSQASLVAAVDRLAAIRIGQIQIAFTPGQLEELAHRASKRGHSVQQELEAVVARIRDELFHRGA